MKYIKTYDDRHSVRKSESPYKLHDYVFFYDEDQEENDKWQKGRIIELFIRKGTLWYEIELAEGELKGYHTSVLLPDIKRLLTKEEIEEIQIKNSAEQYNL